MIGQYVDLPLYYKQFIHMLDVKNVVTKVYLLMDLSNIYQTRNTLSNYWCNKEYRLNAES